MPTLRKATTLVVLLGLLSGSTSAAGLLLTSGTSATASEATNFAIDKGNAGMYDFSYDDMGCGYSNMAADY